MSADLSATVSDNVSADLSAGRALETWAKSKMSASFFRFIVAPLNQKNNQNFHRFLPNFGEKLVFFLKNQCYGQILQNI
jgi:hypothetical protein